MLGQASTNRLRLADWGTFFWHGWSSLQESGHVRFLCLRFVLWVQAPTAHLFDDPEHGGARQGPVGMALSFRNLNPSLSVCGCSPADRGSHVVDRAAIAIIQERTRLLAELAVTILVSRQIGFHKSITGRKSS